MNSPHQLCMDQERCILIAGNVREDMVGMKGVVVVLALYIIEYRSEFNDFAINIKVLL